MAFLSFLSKERRACDPLLNFGATPQIGTFIVSATHVERSMLIWASRL